VRPGIHGRRLRIDLEALILARELLDKTEIVKCGGQVEEFWVETQLLLTALLSSERVDAKAMVNEEIGGILTQDFCDLFREQRIGGMAKVEARVDG
jgi:hypothetical protein